MKQLNNKSGFVLILSVFAMLFLGILLFAAFLRTEMEFKESDSQIRSQQAFYAAEAGLQQALYELRQDYTWRPAAGNEVNVFATTPTATLGSYSLEIIKATHDYKGFESVWVKSIGRDKHKSMTRAIKTRMIVENPASFFISTSGDLHLGSGLNLQGDVLAKDVYFDVDHNSSNASIYVSKVFHLGKVEGLDDPNVIRTKESEPGDDIIPFQSVSFPGVDYNRFQNIVSEGRGIYIESPNSSYDINSSELNSPNGVVVVNGDITLSGEIKKNMLIVASGNIYINGNIKTSDSVADPDKPQLGLFAKKDVIIKNSAPSGSLFVEAFIVADGDGPSNGVFTAEGAPGEKGNLTFKGALSLRGEAATKEEQENLFNLNVYKNRTYSYNSALKTYKIPYVTYIANIVFWKEINPSDALDPDEN